MAIAAVGGMSLSLGAGIAAGKLLGASWLSASIFMVTDLTVCCPTFLCLHHIMPTQILLINLAKFVAANILGRLAGFHLNRYLLGESKGIQPIQALGAQAVAYCALALCVTVANKVVRPTP